MALSVFEKWVIEQKGTEAPFTGELNEKKVEGFYHCKKCDAALYRSEHKFPSHCGWPSFDDEIQGTIKKIADADGRRTEILCAKCDAHLGHVFTGENYTSKNLRHCVNSISLTFKAAPNVDVQYAIFASGCFWGTEFYFAKHPAVLKTTVGYTGGNVPHPTYEQVCAGRTGHVEGIKVEYDAKLATYEDMCKLFFETHDFTQIDGQGPDIGSQYLSVLFFRTDDQKKIAERLVRYLNEKGAPAATKLEKEAEFYPAEDYHQKYYFNQAKTPYCHVYRKIF